MATKSTTLNLSRLNHVTFGQFLTSSLQHLKENNVEVGNDAIVLALMTKIEQQLPLFITASTAPKVTSLAKQVSEANKIRNHDLSALFNYLKSLQFHRNLEKQQAAKTLLATLTPFKKIATLSYEKESAQITQLLKLLEKNDSQILVNNSGAEEAISHLKQSQEDFYKLFLKHTEQTKQSNSSGDIKELRSDLITHYKALYNHLTTLVTLDNSSPYATMFNCFNDIRNYYATGLAHTTKTNKTPLVAINTTPSTPA